MREARGGGGWWTPPYPKTLGHPNGELSFFSVRPPSTKVPRPGPASMPSKRTEWLKKYWKVKRLALEDLGRSF